LWAHGSRQNIPTPPWLKFTQLPATENKKYIYKMYIFQAPDPDVCAKVCPMWLADLSDYFQCVWGQQINVYTFAHLIKSLARHLFNIFPPVYRHLQCASDMKNSEQLSYTYAKYLVQLQCVIGSLRLISIIAMENIN